MYISSRAVLAQLAKYPELRSLKEVQRANVSWIPGRGIGVREKILATPSVGMEGVTHVRRYTVRI